MEFTGVRWLQAMKMLQDIQLPLNLGHHPSRHPAITNAQVRNLYYTNEALAPVASHKKSQVNFPGNKIRGFISSNLLEKLIVVVDSDVYTYDGQDIQLIGSDVLPGSNRVKIVENYINQVAFLAEGRVFIFDTTTKVFAENINIGSLVVDITFQDTYFFFAFDNSSIFKVSVQNNGLDVIQDFSGVANGIIVAISAFEQQIWVFTKTNVNVFIDTGTFPNIYARDKTLAPNYGCLGENTVATDYGLLCWAGITEKSSPFIMVSTGGQPEILSNEDIDYVLDKVPDFSNAIGMLYQMDGHTFYHLYFPKGGFGFIYDFYSKLFFEITYANYVEDVLKYGNTYYAIVNKSLYLHNFDVSITEEDGKIVDRYVIFPVYTERGKMFNIARIYCYIETGFAKKGSCEVAVSYDKGVVFEPLEVQSFPEPGTFGYFFEFRQLGSAYFANIKLRFNVDGKFALREALMTV